MALQFSVAYRNATLNAFETTVGTSARMYINSGPPPANCAAADTGTNLVIITLPADWMGDATAGSKVLQGSWVGSGVAVGNAGHFRIKDSTGTNTHMQGTISITGGGGDMSVDNVSIAVGQQVTAQTFILTAPGS